MQVCTDGWMVANFRTMASGATWWPTLELCPLAPTGGQKWNYSQWQHVVVKFGTKASGATWWTNLELWLVVPLGGQIWNYV